MRLNVFLGQAKGLFGRRDFIYPETNIYRCPAGQSLIWRFTTVEKGMTTGARLAGLARSRRSARRRRSVASSAGNMRQSSMPCSSA